MNHIDPIKLLKDRQGDKSLREYAKEISCSAPYLSDLYNGRRQPGPQILRFLGLVKVQTTDVYYIAAENAAVKKRA